MSGVSPNIGGSFWCEYALIGQEVEQGVLLETAGGLIGSVSFNVQAPATSTRLPGLTIPGLANAHSHAFHRALRGRTHEGTGSFWTWREQMYAVAQKLTPDSYYQLARGVYGEMVLAGVTAVGEFHYVHHQPDGTPYTDPNAMGLALLAAANDAGLRITLLDTAYLHGGIAGSSADGGYQPISDGQQRFSDGSVTNWSARVANLLGTANSDRVRIGSAIHSVRALSVTEMGHVGDFANENGLPLHVHLSETLTENEQCQNAFTASPTELLQQAGVLSPQLTAIHATHMADPDIRMLKQSESSVCLCPTTERDLADGIGPSTQFAQAGIDISLGSDSHAVIDMFEESRAVELNERLLSNLRGNHSVSALMSMASGNGYRALGWKGGLLRAGQLADFVSVRLDSVRMAGTSQETALASVVFGASPSDVDGVVVGGRLIAQGGKHESIKVADELNTSIAQVTEGIA